MGELRAPFPWFGGKSRVAGDVWRRLGDVTNYVEPFFGSGAVLLGRPAKHEGKIETVNDLDGFVANFWRAVADAPTAVSGDWERCLSESVTTRHGVTGIFLDPPYGDDVDQARVYAIDSGTVATDVRTWCVESGNNKLLRIALCGYAGEGHEVLLDYGWTESAWRARGGYGGGRGGQADLNRTRERIYFSPACEAEDDDLLGLLEGA